MTKKGQQKSTKNEKEVVEKDKKPEEDAEEVNSGFANYLRSSSGLFIVQSVDAQKLLKVENLNKFIKKNCKKFIIFNFSS